MKCDDYSLTKLFIYDCQSYTSLNALLMVSLEHDINSECQIFSPFDFCFGKYKKVFVFTVDLIVQLHSKDPHIHHRRAKKLDTLYV